MVGGLTGCSGDADRDRAVLDVARQFGAAVDAGDGDAACALLAPATREALERDAGASCAQALLDEDLPAAGSGPEPEVFGTAAQVRSGTDTIFLGLFGDGWRVTAAGCAAAGDKPYACAVEGG